MRLRIGFVGILIVCAAACAPRGPVIDTGPKPEGVGGTISGTVRASGGAVDLSARRVTAIDLATGQRYETSTAANGGYTIKVPTGKYRLEVELRAGETLSEQPDDTEVNASDMDAQRHFIIAVKSPLSR